MRKIKVKSAFPKEKDGGFKLAISETHNDHITDENPEGQLYIADDEVHNVAFTQGVGKALAEKRLIEVNAKGDPVNEEDALEPAPAPPADDKGK